MKLRILCIDDQYGADSALRESLVRSLSDEGPVAKWCDLAFCSGQTDRIGERVNDIDVALQAVGGASAEAEQWNLALIDAQFFSGVLSPAGVPEGRPGDDTFGDVLRRELNSRFPELPIVMLSGKRHSELVDQDVSYLSKRGLNARALKRTLLRSGRLSIDERRSLLELSTDTVAQSAAVLRAYEEAFIHARSGVPCLLLGETGVGKELLARYIHDQSRRGGPCVKINISAIPKDLVESELFGIEKNTATGVAARAGRFEQADGGSLFLDEIGDLSLESQVKLLRALQDGEVSRVGARHAKRLDVRLITATSQDLEAMIKAGTFRKDLLYRINTVVLTLPPLRERPDDIAPIAEALLARFQTEIEKEGIVLSQEALDRLCREPFWGNVRELESIVRRIVAAAGSHEVITAAGVSHATSPADPEVSVALNSAAGRAPMLNSHLAASSEGTTASYGTPATQHKHSHNDRAISLAELPRLLDAMNVDLDDPGLNGFKQSAEAALGRLLVRAAGAALERCRDPITGELNRQKAMKLLSGDEHLRGKGPARMINELLHRPLQVTVETKDLEEIVVLWRRQE